MSIEAFEKIKAAEEQNLEIKNSANEKYRETVAAAKKEAERILDSSLAKQSEIQKQKQSESKLECDGVMENGNKDAAIKAAAVKVRAEERFASAVDLIVKGVKNIGDQ